MLAVGLHRQLLEVGREALQVLVVGHHADRLRAEEVRVPHGQQPHEHRQVLGQRGGPEVLVHGVEAGQHLVELLRPDRHHRRQADGRVHRVAAADPVPEAEHVGGVDAELRHPLGRSSRRRRSAWRSPTCRPAAPSTQSRAEVALVSVSRVPKVFDDTMKSVSSAERSLVASTKSVESTLETKRNVRSRRV